MFTVSSAAARELLAAAERSQAGELALRVAARRQADGSIEFGMGFDDFREEDEATEVEGLRVVVGAPSRALLASTRLDYVEVQPGRYDFIFAETADETEAHAQQPAPPAKSCGSGGCGNCGG
jgi:iron-sulfur cluster assembly protein